MLSCLAAACLVLALGGLHVLAAGHGAAPHLSRVTPLEVRKGVTITVRGTGFLPGKRRNPVVFRGRPGSVDDVWVRRTTASSATKLVFRAPAAKVTQGGPGAVSGRLQVKNANGISGRSAPLRFDDDGDGLYNEQELRLGTDPRKPDSDGDGTPDGGDRSPTGGAGATAPGAGAVGGGSGGDSTPQAPDTAIDSPPHGTTADALPEFLFHAIGTATGFECSIDSGTATFGACSGDGAHTPAAPLAPGSYTFRVRALGQGGFFDASPAVESFTVTPGTGTSCDNPGPQIAGSGLTSTYAGLENVTAEGRAKIAHTSYTGSGFLAICLMRKKLGDSDATYQPTRPSSQSSATVLVDGQRPEKSTEYVYRTDVVTTNGYVPGANTVVARGAASVASVEGWAQLEENCSHCGSSSIQGGSLRSTVLGGGSGPGAHVGELAVYKGKVALGWHPAALPDHPEQAGTLVSTRVLVPPAPAEPGTHLSAQLILSRQHPATVRSTSSGTAVDFRDSSEPWISVEVRRNADGSVKVVARDSLAPAGIDRVVAESADIAQEGLQNIYITVQMSAPDRYTVRYKPNTQDPDEDVTLDLASGAEEDRALPGTMPEVWLSLNNEMSRTEAASHDVRFDDVDAVYQTDYRDQPVESFGGTSIAIDLPPGFNQTQLTAPLLAPTAIDFAANGDLYIALRDGKVLRLPHEAPEGAANEASLEEVLDINDLINSGLNDHGLLGFVLDPNFAANGFFYAYYTVQKADTFEDRTVSRVERFHLDTDGTAHLDDPLRKVLVGADAPAPPTGDPTTDSTCPPGPTSDCLPSDHYTHSAGAVAFGADGMLWISTPDGATPDGTESGGTDRLSLRAVNPDSLAGKLLRVDPATGAAAPGNPNYAAETNKRSPRARTWAMGFRNPYRMAQRPGSPQTWYVADVGWGAWEEVDAIPGTATAGSTPNYGWPCYEGEPASTYKTLYPTECNIPNPRSPLYAYDSTGVDHAIIGAAFYSGTSYPAPWKPAAGEAAFYYGDYPSGDITMIKTDSSDQMFEAPKVFAGGFTSPVMITEGPVDRAAPIGEQTLHVVDLGAIDQPIGTIWRITYEGP